MMKTMMMVSALALTAPALAQDAPQAATTPSKTVVAPQNTPAPDGTTVDTAAQTTPAAPVQSAPIAGAPVTDTATATPQTTPAQQPAQTADATPAGEAGAAASEAGAAASPTQIAQVVETEFPSYDKNADGNLEKAEFAQWMVALKTASDPATKATDPATKKWVDGAFASADIDKSKQVSKAELTTYLSQGA